MIKCNTQEEEEKKKIPPNLSPCVTCYKFSFPIEK